MKTALTRQRSRPEHQLALVARETRRLVGLERTYSCGTCGAGARSWTRLAACPRCASRLDVAVIRRAAVAG